MTYKFGFIGAGNMGGALLTAAAKNNPSMKIAVFDVMKDKATEYSLKYQNVESVSLEATVTESEYVFIGVKPQMLGELFTDIAPLFGTASPILVSMAAGTSIEKLCTLSGKEMPVIRIMPNTPASIGEGVILYCSNELVTDNQVDFFVKTMSGAGLLDKIDENKIDAASAVSGCGPAFCYMFIEALADGAVECGIPRDKAMMYAAKMLSGSADMVLQSGKHPGALKDAVCSPGGTTIAGVHALEDGAFRSAVMNAVTAAYKRTLELK
ncbi:MAG: pyrroline-5-carboxylate reductase [Ruminococcaceae bacterium]|nr:pyrroline-5-carboxylate reductase [Oscillospiraceae bacterium]MBR3597455.1 pyrroline-5-carboxylate reductase [Clostridia bacterium]